MFTALAQIITGFLYKNKIINGSKLDIYIYGFEVLISNIVCLTIALTIGLLFHEITEVILFLISFIMLRKYCGGYHAESYLKCDFIFTIDVLTVLCLSKYIIVYPLQVHIIIYVIGFIVVIWKAPIENKYKPLTQREKKEHKVTSIIITNFIFVFSTLMLLASVKYCFIIDMALVTVTLFMIFGSIMKGGNLNERSEENAS